MCVVALKVCSCRLRAHAVGDYIDRCLWEMAFYPSDDGSDVLCHRFAASMVCVPSVFFRLDAVAVSSHVKTDAGVAFFGKMVHGRQHAADLAAESMDEEDRGLGSLLAAYDQCVQCEPVCGRFYI